MLRLRPPTNFDIPAILAILEDHQNSFLDDYTTFTKADIIPVISTAVVIADKVDYPIGMAWVTFKRDDLWLSLATIIRPEYLRRAYKDNVLEGIINWAFQRKVGKIKVFPRVKQKGVIKVLKRVGFKTLSPLYKETKVNKVKTDILPMELRQGYWQKKTTEVT